MAYRDDEDLVFLRLADHQDLDELVRCLVYDKDGSKRYSEGLSEKPAYQEFQPQHGKYWKDIAEEIQRYGANGVATMLFRGGKGVLYREVLTDVCEKMDVEFDSSSTTQTIEDQLLMKILTDAVGEMSKEDMEDLFNNLKFNPITGSLSKDALLTAFQSAFLAGGFKSYQLTLIVVNAISKAVMGRGLTLAGNAALMRSASILTGPIGWTITGLWTAVDLAGPAFRVTIPAVIHVALLRKKVELSQEDLEDQLSQALNP